MKELQYTYSLISQQVKTVKQSKYFSSNYLENDVGRQVQASLQTSICCKNNLSAP